MSKAFYFPVETPFRMRPGLFRLGHDFGNGVADSEWFQRDEQFDHYQRGKRERTSSIWRASDIDRSVERNCQEEIINALDEKDLTDLDGPKFWLKLSTSVQEDIVICQVGNAGDRVVFVDVSFPSGWDPAGIQGKSFFSIHKPVPEFSETRDVAAKFANIMTQKGPYVRFVWTLSRDLKLDHHPSVLQPSWKDCKEPGFRVERQIIIPIQGCAALFLIRTYVYPLAELSPAQINAIRASLATMSAETLRYKGLTDCALLT